MGAYDQQFIRHTPQRSMKNYLAKNNVHRPNLRAYLTKIKV